MPNWIENLVKLDGPLAEVQRFRQAVSGDRCDLRECKNEDFCVHRLIRMVADSERKYVDWCSAYRVAFLEPFDHENRRFEFNSAWRPVLHPFGFVSCQFPSLTFDVEFCDPCEWNGCRFDWFSTRIRNGAPEYMRCAIDYEYAANDVRQTEFEIDSIRDFFLLGESSPHPEDPRMESLAKRYPLLFGELDESYRVANPPRESQEPTAGSA